jgi:hypothetical protein
MDPWFLPAQVNLATLYNRMGRNRDAEHVLGVGHPAFPCRTALDKPAAK